MENIEKIQGRERGKGLFFVFKTLDRKNLWKNFDVLKRTGLFPLLIAVVVCSVAANIIVGDLAIDLLNPLRWCGIGGVVLLFVLVSFLLDIFNSFYEIKNFKNPESGHINVAGLWRKVFTNPLNGVILIVIMTFGLTSAQNLSEFYRIHVTSWHDAAIWALEAPLFYFLKGSLIDIPIFWDRVYFAYWVYVMLVYCALYRMGKLHDLAVISIATVFCYFLTRWAALQYPTAGPVFYQPSLFDLSGTISGVSQKWLVLYMQGGLSQNGFIPGTMGMPSLHIGITVMAAWFLAIHVRWTLWVSLAWICLTWLSTIMLGWHYALDGIGGILIAVIAVPAAIGILKIIPAWSI
jgi:hypothetical protein